MTAWRHDPLTDRTARVAPGREKRPNDFAGEASGRRCPFCVGSEASTPAELGRVSDGDGGWLARVVPNRYPIVDGDGGAHEVVIESPRHAQRYVDLTDDERVAAVTAWATRVAAHRDAGRFGYVLLFKNEGPAAGASLRHVHSQVIAFPEAPPGVAAMRRRVAEADRVGVPVTQTGGWRLSVPEAPRADLETWIAPAKPRPFNTELAADVSAVLRQTLLALDAAAFNLVLQLPPGGAEHDHEPWWIEVVPRTSAIAGVELATGRWYNTISPEDAAQTLRERLAAGG